MGWPPYGPPAGVGFPVGRGLDLTPGPFPGKEGELWQRQAALTPALSHGRGGV